MSNSTEDWMSKHNIDYFDLLKIQGTVDVLLPIAALMRDLTPEQKAQSALDLYLAVRDIALRENFPEKVIPLDDEVTIP